MGRGGVAAALLALFVAIEARVATPLMPLALLRVPQVAAANVIAVLWAGGMFAWFFIAALYLQRVLGYDVRAVGLAFLPSNVIMAIFSVGISAWLTTRFGLRAPLAVGLLLAAAGLGLFALARPEGGFATDVLPGMVFLGLGSGMAFNPLMLAAMSDVAPSETGLASGIVNTAFMMGGALGLAVLASLAAASTSALVAEGAGELAALSGGYRRAFVAGATCAVVAAALAWRFVRRDLPVDAA